MMLGWPVIHPADTGISKPDDRNDRPRNDCREEPDDSGEERRNDEAKDTCGDDRAEHVLHAFLATVTDNGEHRRYCGERRTLHERQLRAEEGNADGLEDRGETADEESGGDK